MLLALAIFVLTSFRTSKASLFITSPVQSTNCVGGKPCLLTWTNDKALPDLSAYGLMTVGLWTGSETQQTELVKLGHVDPKESNTMNVIIPPKIGVNGNQYFIRMDQVSPDHPGDPYQAFSAHFDLSGMSGAAAPVTPPPPHPEAGKGVIGGPNSSIIVAVPPSSPTGAPTVGRIIGTSSGGVSTASLHVFSQAPTVSSSSLSPMATAQTPPASIISGSESYKKINYFLSSFIFTFYLVIIT